MVGVGDTVFVVPLYGQKDNLAVLTGPAGSAGDTGAAGGMVAYWSEMVAHLKFFSDMERSYSLTRPPVNNYKCTVEEVLKTVEFTAIPETLMVPPGFVSWRAEGYTTANHWTHKIGLAITLSTTEITLSSVLPNTTYGCRLWEFSGMLHNFGELIQNGSYVCFGTSDGYATPSYPCDDAPNYSSETLFLQAWIFSQTHKTAPAPSATAYIKNLVVGATAFYDQRTATLDTGTSTAVAETIITDTSKSWSPSAWIGKMAEISSGPAFGKQALITANDITTITCSAATFVTDGMNVGNPFNIIG